MLVQPENLSEIDDALKSISNCKAPGTDGLNAVFFKKTWHIVKYDVYAAVIQSLLFLSPTIL